MLRLSVFLLLQMLCSYCNSFQRPAGSHENFALSLPSHVSRWSAIVLVVAVQRGLVIVVIQLVYLTSLRLVQ